MAAILAGGAGASARAEECAEGLWRAWLDSPGGELPFGLELREVAGELTATIRNAAERIEIPRVERRGQLLILAMDHYDSRIEALLDESGREMTGTWSKAIGPGGESCRLAFRAIAGSSPRFRSRPAQPSVLPGDASVEVQGRWRVQFDGEDDPAVGIFWTRPDQVVEGTFLTTTGDYRYLEGCLQGRRLRLSCFDGAHAFLFDADVVSDGSLRGQFWSRDSWHQTWTATRDAAAELPDAFLQTHLADAGALARLRFPDLTGESRALLDPEFTGKVTLLYLFGSWCPNCHDAGHYFRELRERYGARGLSILGLAFELTGDFDRDAAQVRRYAARHGIDYPLLLAGLSDKQRATEAFPALDRIRSYPTTLFLDRSGRVRAIHTGFSGPATEDAHRRMREHFETWIERLLSSEQ